MAKRTRAQSPDVATGSPPSKILKVLQDDNFTEHNVEEAVDPSANTNSILDDIVMDPYDDRYSVTNSSIDSDPALSGDEYVVSYGPDHVYTVVHGWV